MGSVQRGSPEPYVASGVGKGLSELRDTARIWSFIFHHLLWFLGLNSRLPVCYVSTLSLSYGPGQETVHARFGRFIQNQYEKELIIFCIDCPGETKFPKINFTCFYFYLKKITAFNKPSTVSVVLGLITVARRLGEEVVSP